MELFKAEFRLAHACEFVGAFCPHHHMNAHESRVHCMVITTLTPYGCFVSLPFLSAFLPTTSTAIDPLASLAARTRSYAGKYDEHLFMHARHIFDRYLARGAPLEVNIPFAIKDQIGKALQIGKDKDSQKEQDKERDRPTSDSPSTCVLSHIRVHERCVSQNGALDVPGKSSTCLSNQFWVLSALSHASPLSFLSHVLFCSPL